MSNKSKRVGRNKKIPKDKIHMATNLVVWGQRDYYERDPQASTSQSQTQPFLPSSGLLIPIRGHLVYREVDPSRSLSIEEYIALINNLEEYTHNNEHSIEEVLQLNPASPPSVISSLAPSQVEGLSHYLPNYSPTFRGPGDHSSSSSTPQVVGYRYPHLVDGSDITTSPPSDYLSGHELDNSIETYTSMNNGPIVPLLSSSRSSPNIGLRDELMGSNIINSTHSQAYDPPTLQPAFMDHGSSSHIPRYQPLRNGQYTTSRTESHPTSGPQKRSSGYSSLSQAVYMPHNVDHSNRRPGVYPLLPSHHTGRIRTSTSMSNSSTVLGGGYELSGSRPTGPNMGSSHLRDEIMSSSAINSTQIQYQNDNNTSYNFPDNSPALVQSALIDRGSSSRVRVPRSRLLRSEPYPTSRMMPLAPSGPQRPNRSNGYSSGSQVIYTAHSNEESNAYPSSSLFRVDVPMYPYFPRPHEDTPSWDDTHFNQ